MVARNNVFHLRTRRGVRAQPLDCKEKSTAAVGGKPNVESIVYGYDSNNNNKPTRATMIL
jgi:hypothetical protein